MRIFGIGGQHPHPRRRGSPPRGRHASRSSSRSNKDKEPQEIVVETSDWLYGIEADTVAANLEHRQADVPRP